MREISIGKSGISKGHLRVNIQKLHINKQPEKESLM